MHLMKLWRELSRNGGTWLCKTDLCFGRSIDRSGMGCCCLLGKLAGSCTALGIWFDCSVCAFVHTACPREMDGNGCCKYGMRYWCVALGEALVLWIVFDLDTDRSSW